MSQPQAASLFTQVDITAGSHIPRPANSQLAQAELLSLLSTMLAVAMLTSACLATSVRLGIVLTDCVLRARIQATCRNRTDNLRFTKALLCQLS